MSILSHASRPPRHDPRHRSVCPCGDAPVWSPALLSSIAFGVCRLTCAFLHPGLFEHCHVPISHNPELANIKPWGVLQGEMANYLAMDCRSSWDEQLFAFTARGRSWAKQRGLDLYIRTLTKGSLGFENKTAVYPELTSRIKASRARVLLAFLSSVVSDVEQLLPADATDQQRYNAKLRGTMVWTLDATLSIWGCGGRPFLSPAEVEHSCRYLQAHLVSYQALACSNLDAGILLYKTRPKAHYMCHLLEHTRRTAQNPIHFACFVDEDMMKQMKACVHACHPSSMLRTWCRRYVLKRVLVWARLQKK